MSVEPWTTLSEEPVYENRWVQVKIQQVRLPGGLEYEYTIVDRPAQGVAIILLDEMGRVLLTREYRHAIGRAILQLPGGLIDEGEQPIESARRELREETGYEAGEWIELSRFYDNPALGNASSQLFLARHPRRVAEVSWDEAESLEVLWLPLAQLREAVVRGEIVDRVLLSALAMLWARGLV